MNQRGRHESSRTKRAPKGRERETEEEGRVRARKREREERWSAAARNTKLHALRIMNSKLFPSWMIITLRGCVSSVYCSKLLFASWMRSTHFFVDEDTLSGDAFHLFIVVSPSSLHTFVILWTIIYRFSGWGTSMSMIFIQKLRECIFIENLHFF
jgi:hypothetical protein